MFTNIGYRGCQFTYKVFISVVNCFVLSTLSLDFGIHRHDIYKNVCVG